MAEPRSAFDEAMPSAAGALWEAVKSALSGPSAAEQIQANQEAKNALIRQKKYAEAAKLGLIDDPLTGAFAGSTILRAGPGIRAYHGSPHDFDKFSLSKIGTGEGAQAYGHGLYFAGNEGVARSYRDALSPGSGNTTKDIAARWLKEFEGDADAARAALQERISRSYDAGDIAAADGLRAVKGQLFDPKALTGHMYEVNINAPESAFLDWDAPIANQSEQVQSALRALEIKPAGKWEVNGDNLSRIGARGQEATIRKIDRGNGPEWLAEYDTMYNRGSQRFNSPEEAQKWIDTEAPIEAGRGAEIYTALQKETPDAKASSTLFDAGIPGIRYLDGGSRSLGDGTRNYVVFDDSLIDILRKYGLAGLTTAGAAAAASDLYPEEGAGMADGGSIMDIGALTLAPGAPRDDIDPVTGLPRINLSPLVTPSASTTPPGYNPGSQLAKWFPSGTSIDTWRPKVNDALTRPIDPTVLVPSTTQEVLGDINGGEGRSGPAGSNTGTQSAFGDDMTGSDRAPNYATMGVPGIVGAGLSAAIPGLGWANSLGNLANMSMNQASLARMGYSMTPGQVLGAALGWNGYSGFEHEAMNAAMNNEEGRGAFSGKGPTSQDVDSALAAYASSIENAMAPADAPTNDFDAGFGTSPNAPTGPSPEVSALGDFSGGDISGGMGADVAGGDIGGGSGVAGAEGRYASGGHLSSGSYIVPADVVGAFGNGSTIAGARHLGMALGGRLVDGPGDGRSDDIPFSGPGGRQIRLSNGEVVIPPEGVQAAGGPDRLDRAVMQKRKKQRKAMSAFGPPAR